LSFGDNDQLVLSEMKKVILLVFLVCYSVGILGVAGKKSKDKTVTLEKQDR
jgi:hypothetical protein